MRKIYIAVLIFGIAIGLYFRDLLREKPAAAKIITIRSRNLEYQVETRAETVGELNVFVIPAEAGVQSPGRGRGQAWIPDQVRDDKLTNGMMINITKPVNVVIRDGGDEPKNITSTAETVDDLLREQKIGLASTDRVMPDVNTYLAANLTVQIDRIVDLEVTENSEIPFGVNIEHDPSSFYGREEVLEAGVLGRKEQKFLITYKNGIEIKRRLLSETVLQKPKTEQRRLGTRIEIEQTQEGRASWYDYKDCLCAAHPSFEKGRFVRVTALNSGKTIIVKINDRGPDQAVHPDRVIDLDSVAYKELASLGSGTIAVRVELLKN